MSEFSFFLDGQIKISHTENTAPASLKFIMNRLLQSLLSVQLPWGQKY